MSKTLFIVIALILSVNAWDLKILSSVINNNTIPVFAVAWMMAGYFHFSNLNGYGKHFRFGSFNLYFYWLVLGFALSFVTANLFWGQDFMTSLIVNRRLVFFLFLPVFFSIQPSEKEIINSLGYYTIFYMMVWFLQSITPYPITTSLEIAIEAGRGTFELSDTDFGQLLSGYSLMLILLYYRIEKFIENVSFRTFIPAMMMLGIFFLLQNRGTLFFAILVFGFAFFKIQTKYRYFFIFLFGALILGAYVVTEKYWLSFMTETTEQLADPNYNRWKALYYFLFHYSPHWLCYVFGNGYLSAKIESGQFIIALMSNGFYQADLGIIGFWSMYGVIPVLVIYSIIFRILFYIQTPFYLKALGAHVLLVPICWGFSYFDMLLLVILAYLAGYYSFAYDERTVQVQYTY